MSPSYVMSPLGGQSDHSLIVTHVCWLRCYTDWSITTRHCIELFNLYFDFLSTLLDRHARSVSRVTIYSTLRTTVGSVVNVANSEDLLAVSSEHIVAFTLSRHWRNVVCTFTNNDG